MLILGLPHSFGFPIIYNLYIFIYILVMGDISILILVSIDIVSYRLRSTKDIDTAGHAYLLQLYIT